MDPQELTHRLERIGEMSAESVRQLHADLAADATADINGLTQRLVKRGKLTPFQAECLVTGHPARLVYGTYTIHDRIGQGGMGVVYKVRRQGEAKFFALKVLSKAGTRDAEVISRFRREVEAASRLQHPHLVAAIDSGEEHGELCYVMEYVPGNNLAEVVKTHGPLPVGTAVNCMIQAARGLSFIHSYGITHRDVKPSNLMLDTSGTIRIVDLGLARMTHADTASEVATVTALTRTGSVLGTIDYMAPEQAVNTRKADFRSDIYGLGCTLYFLLTGRAPYQGETMMEVLVSHREDPIPSLKATRTDVPADLERLHQQMQAKKPQDRPSSMQEVLHRLERVKQDHGMAWIMDRVISKRKR